MFIIFFYSLDVTNYFYIFYTKKDIAIGLYVCIHKFFIGISILNSKKLFGLHVAFDSTT